MAKTITIDQQIIIDATPATVFAFACDYRNDPCWRSGVREMTVNSQDETHAGSRTSEVMRVLGRTTRTEALVTIHETNHRTGFRTQAGDLTAHGHRQTERTGNRTTFSYYAEATLDPPFRWLARPIEWIFNRRAAADLRSLAALLDQRARNGP